MRFWRSRAEADLEREIAHHLRELTRSYERAGYGREEALLMAKREFGGRELTKEQCRDERQWAWVAGWWQDVVFGLRMMRRAPVITVAAVASLALGIGANTAIVSLMDVVLWRELPVPRPTQLAFVDWRFSGAFPSELMDAAAGGETADATGRVANFFSYSAFQELRRSIQKRAELAAFISFTEPVSVSAAGRPTVAQERGVSGNFFSTLKIKPELGRFFTDSDDAYDAPAVAVVSRQFWLHNLGGRRNAVGRSMRINNRPYVIAGILPGDFYGLLPGDPGEIYTPLHHSSFVLEHGKERRPLNDSRFWCVSILGRLAHGTNVSELQIPLDTVFPSTWSKRLKEIRTAPHIQVEGGARGLGSLRQEFRSPLLLLAGLVGLLLAIACTNLANLLLARATARQKEVAMRISLGCSRIRLLRQLLTENALLAILGGAASVAVAYVTANLLGQFLADPDTFPVTITLDSRVFVIVMATSGVALLLFGVLPAWRVSRVSTFWLKEGSGSIGTAARRRWSIGRALVLVQVAMSVVLVFSAVVFTRNLVGIQSADTGFDKRNLILFGLRPGTSGYQTSQLPKFYRNLTQRLSATPGVAQVGLASMRPMNIGGWWERVKLGQKAEQASINGVSAGYLPLYASHMIAGRGFSPTDVATEAKVAVISADLARKLAGGSVLGRLLVFDDGPPGAKRPEYEIVGIAPAVAATSMKQRPYTVWVPLGKEAREVTVVLRTQWSPQMVLPAIRKTMSELDRNLPLVDVNTMEQQISKTLQRERMFATLCNGFGVLALVLSAVGLYGVMAYNTSRRRSEIGVRLALGARPRQVLVMVLLEGGRMVVLGVLLAVPLVWLGAGYLEKELFQMKPLELGSIATALSILLSAAFAAVAIPAARAACLQPSDTLRQN